MFRDATMRQRVEMRIPTAVTVYAVCWALLCGVVLLAGVLGLPALAFLLVMLPLEGALILRVQTVKFVADESGLLVRNLVRTWRFRWDEVEDFRVGRGPCDRLIFVMLRNGEVFALDVTAYSWASRGGRARRDPMVQALRQWLPPERVDA
jgi:hypothetical protein